MEIQKKIDEIVIPLMLEIEKTATDTVIVPMIYVRNFREYKYELKYVQVDETENFFMLVEVNMRPKWERPKLKREDVPSVDSD